MTVDSEFKVFTYLMFNQSKTTEFFLTGGKARYAYYTKIND